MNSDKKATEERFEEVNMKIEYIKQYQRRNNVIMSGVPQKDNEDIYEILQKIGEASSFPISKRDIDIAHRLPTRKATGPQPIVVKFTNRWMKADLLKKKVKIAASHIGLGSSNQLIFFNDHLTPYQSTLAYKARQLRDRLGGRDKDVATWTAGGKVFFKRATDVKANHYKLCCATEFSWS